MHPFFARTFVICALACLAASVSRAGDLAEFYGVKMKSESYLSSIDESEWKNQPTSLGDHAGVDKQLSATARIRQIWGHRDGIDVRVFNNSQAPLPTNFHLLRFTVVTRDGKRHLLEEPPQWYPAMTEIEPGKSAEFKPEFDGATLRREDIRFIVVSFDLDTVKIVLVPLKQPAAVAAPERPAPAPIQAIKRGLWFSKKQSKPAPPKPSQSKPAASKPALSKSSAAASTSSVKRPPIVFDEPLPEMPPSAPPAPALEMPAAEPEQGPETATVVETAPGVPYSPDAVRPSAEELPALKKRFVI